MNAASRPAPADRSSRNEPLLAPPDRAYLERIPELYVGYYCLPCRGTCRHCWASELGLQPYREARRLEPAMRACREWLDAAGLEHVGLLFAVLKNGDLYEDWKTYHALLMRYCDLPSGYARVITLPGLPRRRTRDLRAFFQEARAIGIEWISTTLHGAGRVHDSFVRQAGDYAYQKQALRCAREAGLKTNALYFISKRNLGCIRRVQGEFGDLVSRVGDLPLISFRLMQPFGLARQELATFLTRDDVDRLPASLLYSWLFSVDTEANFVARVLEGDDLRGTEEVSVFPGPGFMRRPSPSRFGALVAGAVARKWKASELPGIVRRFGRKDGDLLLTPSGFVRLLEMRSGGDGLAGAGRAAREV